MAISTLASFNAFLTERLTAAAVDIYGFVEKTVLDHQEEVYHTRLEIQRLQRLLDLVYKPEIRLHRAGTWCGGGAPPPPPPVRGAPGLRFGLVRMALCSRSVMNRIRVRLACGTVAELMTRVCVCVCVCGGGG